MGDYMKAIQDTSVYINVYSRWYQNNAIAIEKVEQALKGTPEDVENQEKFFRKTNRKIAHNLDSASKSGKEYLEIKFMEKRYDYKNDSTLDNQLRMAKTILNKEWEETEKLVTERKKMLKECQERDKKINSFNDQTAPIEGQMRTNIITIKDGNRKLKREILRLEAEKMSKSTEFAAKDLSIKAKAAKESNDTIILSGELVVNEALSKLLFLKQELIECTDKQKESLILKSINDYGIGFTKLFTEFPSFASVQELSNNIEARLTEDKNRIISAIQSTLGSYQSFDRIYAGAIGVLDKINQELDELNYKIKMKKLENIGIASELETLKTKHKENCENYKTLKERISILEQSNNEMETIFKSGPMKTQEMINYEKERKDTLDKKDNVTINIIGEVEDAAHSFNTNSNVISEDVPEIAEKRAQLEENINSFKKVYYDLQFQKQRLPKNKECLEFAKSFPAGSKFSNSDLIYYYNKDNLVLTPNKDKNMLIIKGGDASYLTESILNSFNEEPLYNDIIIAGIHLTKDIDLEEHFKQLMDFCIDSKSKICSTNATVEDPTQFLPRKFPPPFFDNQNPEDISDKFIAYIEEWINVSPERMLSNVKIVNYLYDNIDKCQTSRRSITDVKSVLEKARSGSYEPNQAKVTEKPPPDHPTEAFVVAEKFSSRIWETYMKIKLKDCMDLFKGILKDINEGKQIKDITKYAKYSKNINELRRTGDDFAKYIYTTIYHDKKAEKTINIIEAANEAYKNENYGLFAMIETPIRELDNNNMLPREKNQKLKDAFTRFDSFSKILADRREGTEKGIPSHNIFFKELTETINKDNFRFMTSVEMLRSIVPIILGYLKPQQEATRVEYKLPEKSIKLAKDCLEKEYEITDIKTFLAKKKK